MVSKKLTFTYVLQFNKKIIVGSVYRPNMYNPPYFTVQRAISPVFWPTYQFTWWFLKFEHPSYAYGGFKFRCPKIRYYQNVTEYIDFLFSYGFLQLVLKPTRCTPHSATVIDHILSNSHTDNFESFILISKLSDHFPIFHFSKCKNTVDKKNYKFLQRFLKPQF